MCMSTAMQITMGPCRTSGTGVARLGMGIKSAVNSFNLYSDLVQKFLKNYTILAKNGENIVLCFIPSHVGMLGNEKADAAAKSPL